MFGKLYKIILNKIRSLDYFTKLLWGIKIHKKCQPLAWDLTTLILKKELNSINTNLPKSTKYLDMGCGQLAILGQYFKNLAPSSKITSADLYEDLVNCALDNILKNNLEIKVIKSNLFENIEEKFDLITFNPPYVPEKIDKSIKYHSTRYSGIDGTETANKFLQLAKKYINYNGIILLGMNNFYVPENKCVELINQNNYKIKKVTKMAFNSSVVFSIK